MRKFLGKDSFTWFVGVVEDRNDPIQMGRVRVRCFGWHSQEKSNILTEDLPWAVVVTPTTSPSTQGFGHTPVLLEGSWVFGFFMDGERAQEPCIVGSMPTSFMNAQNQRESDQNKLARGQNTITITPDADIGEPSDSYNARYPYNTVYQSESGHIKEYDNTPNHERIRERHKSGSQYEVRPDGSKVTRVVGDNYEIIAGNDSVKIGGNCKLIIVGNLDVTVGGTCNIVSGGNMKLQAPRIDLNPPGGGFGSPNPVLTDPPVTYPRNIRTPQQVAPGTPANSEQIDPAYEPQPPANCGEVPFRNPYDVAAEALALGTSAWAETGSNPNITALWDEIGYNGPNFADETAWCAVFVGAILKRAGSSYIQTASSQAYKNYGIEVPFEEVQQGDIVVFYRDGPDSGLGHVGFATGVKTATTIEVLGGNQSNNLNVKNFRLERFNSSGQQIWGLRSIRRAVNCEDGTTPAPAAGTTATAATGEGGSVT